MLHIQSELNGVLFGLSVMEYRFLSMTQRSKCFSGQGDVRMEETEYMMYAKTNKSPNCMSVQKL